MFTGREGRFFDPLLRQMDLLTEASRLALECARENRNARTEAVPRIDEMRAEAARLDAALVGELRRRLITPLDPEDLVSLSAQIRKALDSIAGAAARLEFCPCQPAPEDLVEELALLHRCAASLRSALGSLKNGALAGHCDEVKALHTRAERIGREARLKLFAGLGEPVDVLRMRETYNLTEMVLGRCAAVGETLKRIKLKHG